MSRAEPSPVTVSAIAGLLYFSEGFPFGIVNELFPLYLRTRGVDLASIGFLSVASLAWTLKFFWSPLVDRVGTYAGWIYGMLGVIAVGIGGLALTDAVTGPIFWSLVVFLALASATHDIAADALTIAITPKAFLGPVNSIRVTTYRIAWIVAGGGLAALATKTGWPVAFAVATLIPIATGVVLFLLLPRGEIRTEEENEQEPRGSIGRALLGWIARPGAFVLLAVVLLFRFGDNVIIPMVKPFWVDRGYSTAEIGTVTTVFGVIFTIAGAWVGGAVVAKLGVKRSLLVLGVLQMASNVGYAWVATAGAPRPGMYAAAMIENFCGGLGTAAFLSFLMSICDRRFAATEYALLSALFAVSRSAAGTVSGVAAEALGYPAFFWMSVALGVPALLVIPFLEENRGNRQQATGNRTQ